LSKAKGDAIILQKEKIQDFSFAYRMYISARKDFVTGIALGITGSITASYIVQLDKTIFNFSSNNVFEILIRIFLLQLILLYIINRYRWRTRIYENSLKGMIERIDEINRDLEKSSPATSN
jgi:hypothetical protein